MSSPSRECLRGRHRRNGPRTDWNGLVPRAQSIATSCLSRTATTSRLADQPLPVDALEVLRGSVQGPITVGNQMPVCVVKGCMRRTACLAIVVSLSLAACGDESTSTRGDERQAGIGADQLTASCGAVEFATIPADPSAFPPADELWNEVDLSEAGKTGAPEFFDRYDWYDRGADRTGAHALRSPDQSHPGIRRVRGRSLRTAGWPLGAGARRLGRVSHRADGSGLRSGPLRARSEPRARSCRHLDRGRRP